MISNSINIKKDNIIWPQIIEHLKDHEISHWKFMQLLTITV